jgi:hypothetical protein
MAYMNGVSALKPGESEIGLFADGSYQELIALGSWAFYIYPPSNCKIPVWNRALQLNILSLGHRKALSSCGGGERRGRISCSN